MGERIWIKMPSIFFSMKRNDNYGVGNLIIERLSVKGKIATTGKIL